MSALGSNRRGRLAEVLGHELRNPLAAAVANISVSMEMTDPGDPRSAFMARALEELTRASTLLTSYLEFGRSGSPSLERTDLLSIARRIEERCRQRQGTIRVKHSGGSTVLPGDPALLERLLENLVENALSMGARCVEIGLARRGGECVLEVADDGPGVPPEMRAHLFEPSVSGRGSTGIGLALCRDVVEAHGGAITHVPSARGAVFQVRLPVEGEAVCH